MECGSNMLWQSGVSHTRTSDREGSVSDSWDVFTRQTIRGVDEAERRRCRASELDDRCYIGTAAGLSRADILYTRTASLNLIRCRRLKPARLTKTRNTRWRKWNWTIVKRRNKPTAAAVKFTALSGPLYCGDREETFPQPTPRSLTPIFQKS